ncbi:SAM-dependent chlorinase/fluorinase [Ruficoccus amylovorans]|uniref:SAM-dependent chlorinase/fluorinase n=1 Tax=Ruficoccus amylovorans TaxID=1804625 RepID=A0A842HFC1_9BACT|nr:SAM-dependent chlorinase/fluorinase [Ruficoccus amylovorans]MBC2594336.1 SAM-dependent chlorinase/fluorinase [Ruficoccus amylovorans]
MDAASPTLIALLTDFGMRDWYVGAMKGVLLRNCPQAQLVDITHSISPGDIEAGAFVLSQCWREFPPGTVFLAVVDPGVGTPRKAVAVRANGHFFVGPDNGLFGFLENYEAREITGTDFHRTGTSHTFHGRDIFAPAAARLASGADFASIGTDSDNLVSTVWPQVEFMREGVHGCIIAFDHFGNAITNLRREDVAVHFSPESLHVSLHPDRLPLVKTFGDVSPGAPLAYFGSGGFLEIAINGGNARDVLGLKKHQTVEMLT